MGEGVKWVWCGRRRLGAAGASSARRRRCGGSSTAPRLAQNEACARTRTKSRERGEGGGKGRGDGRRRSLERAAAVEVGGGRKEGERARDWAGPGGTPRREAKNRLSRRSSTCQGRGRAGGEVVESRGAAYLGEGYAGNEGRRDAGRARGGGRLTDRRGAASTRGACTCDGGGTKWFLPPPATGSRTPNPAGH